MSFGAYLRDTLPRSWTADAPHIKAICDVIDRVHSGEIDRLAIHMPPRHGKTETVTVRAGAFFKEMFPDANVLVTAYNQRIANRFSRKARTICRGRIDMASDNRAQDEWSTAGGGTYMARGVGSPPTGVGFKYIIIDDPIRSREDAESQVYRDRAADWYSDDLYTRLEPGGAIIIVCTRWHHDDVAARAVASEPDRWHILNLPAIAEEDDALGRAPGEALWADRYGVEELERIKGVMMMNGGEYGWSALYQQRPTPREGAFFRSTRITIEDAQPNIKRVARGWDLAASAGKGDYTVGVKLGIDDQERVWILDVQRGQYDADERDRVIRQTAALDGKACRQRLPQDPGQAGKSQVVHMLRNLQGFPVSCKPVSGSKELRAGPISSQIAGGNCFMVKASWNQPILDELRTFPLGKNDDCVDAIADAYDELTLGSVRFGAV